MRSAAPQRALEVRLSLPKFMLSVLVVFAAALLVTLCGVLAMIWGREPEPAELRIYGTCAVIAAACVFTLAATRAVHEVRLRGGGDTASRERSRPQ